MQTLNLGNNESSARGIFVEKDGFIAMTFTASKFFRTYKGAAKWLAARGYVV